MLICILPDAATTEGLLNNLSEADFDLADVSIIMHDRIRRDAIAKDTGPLQGVDLANLLARLAEAGLSQDAAQHCIQAITRGKVLVAMICSPELQPVAKEMLRDHSAHIIQE